MSWRSYAYSIIAAEIGASARYFERVCDASRGAPGNPLLLEHLARRCGAPVNTCSETTEAPPATAAQATAYLINGSLNHSTDIEALLRALRERMARRDRLLIVLYNPYLGWLYELANRVGIRHGPMPQTFITRADLRNLARLAGLEITRYRPTLYIPFRLLGLGTLLNALLQGLPVLRHLALTSVVTLRPHPKKDAAPSLSIIVPARNERGNIASILERLPELPVPLEVLFVEGHSSDGTWEEIERQMAAYRGTARLRALRQTGRGKSDAVRLGFQHATGDLVTILDADLTMPPELLGRFYEAWVAGHADFVNGSRLLYAMESRAMRFLNQLGNVFFAKALSFVLEARITDSLCGTKLFARADLARMQRWRADFGEFDPFGDFELLFPAAILGLGIVDIPIRYRDRTYGTTNIHRFRDGARLLGMTLRGLFRVRMPLVDR